MNSKTLIRNILAVFVVVAAASFGKAWGNPRLLDHIDVNYGSEANAIVIAFHVPVRVVSHLINRASNELSIRVRPVITPGTEADFLGGDETLSWKSTAELPLDKVVFSGKILAESTLLISFSAPIRAFTIEGSKDFSNIKIILPKVGAIEDIQVPESTLPLGVPETEPVAVPEEKAVTPTQEAAQALVGEYVVNLVSQTTPIDFTVIAAAPIPKGRRLYTTQTSIKDTDWYRLRIGFFASLEEARAANKEISHLYPDSWVDRASIEERRRFAPQAAVEPVPETGPKLPVKRKAPVLKINGDKALAPASDRIQRMMEKAREIMTAADYPQAIRLLTAVLEETDSPYQQEALELLGLARERNRQFAHANAEYEKYLELYPDGADADRVRQRLAGLVSAAQKPKKKLRAPKDKGEMAPEWEVFGSLSQAYRRDGIESEFVDDEDAVSRSEIGTNLDVSARRRSADSNVRVEFNGGYDLDLLNDGPGDETHVADAYVDYEGRKTGYAARVGRQRLRSSGIQSRFDGAVVGYRITDNNKLRAYAGLPVESSSDVFLNDEKYFVGASVELNSIVDDIDITLFGIEQRIDSLVDRRGIGGEVRYFTEKRSVFGLVDYDIFHDVLNTALVQTNWTLPTATRMYANYDYRTSPFFTTFNALQNQTNGTIGELLGFFTEDEILALARDRTARSRLFSIGGTHPFRSDFQVSADVTVSNLTATPTSGGVEGAEATGNEFFYTFQVIKNDLLKAGDIGILEMRYADTKTADSYSLTANSRYPVTSLWRINPRLGITYRDIKDSSDSRVTVRGLLRTEYRVRNNFLLEMELGANWNQESLSAGDQDFVDYFFLGGYRWTF